MINEIICSIKASAKENFVPIVRDNTLDVMLELIEKTQPKRILEIGTAVGYSALNMLARCDGDIVTIEKNEDRARQAQSNFKQALVEERVKLLEGDALDVLNGLNEEGEMFDFVFLDGPKGQYIRYLPVILKMLNDGGIIFADNVGLLGLVADSEKVNHKNRTMVRNMQAFLTAVKTDTSLNTEIFDIDDGYAIIQKIK
ncbi:MAG: O-methyltransferase [Clostridiales bacterium]|nr:O-methyltransferase [Clostridiales bacterium]